MNFERGDHNIDEVEINSMRVESTNPDGNEVLFLLECRYQDKYADDKWAGSVDLVVVAEVE